MSKFAPIGVAAFVGVAGLFWTGAPTDAQQTANSTTNMAAVPFAQPRAAAVAIEEAKAAGSGGFNKPSWSEIKLKHQLPENELAKLTTSEIVASIANEEALSVSSLVYFDDSGDGGLAQFAKDYNAVRELLKRPDSARATLDQYRQLTDQISSVSTKNGRTAQGALLFISLASLEVILAAPELQDSMTPSQKNELIREILRSIDARAEYDRKAVVPVFGVALNGRACIPMANALDSLGDQSYKRWKADWSRTSLFIDRGFWYQEVTPLIEIARKYVSQ